MKLDGIHHITAITGDAQGNIDFYIGVLGLRLVKKTVNQDDPTVYHLFFADEQGSAGSDLTFFEYPQAAPGRAGAGMVHQINWRVGSAESLDYWAERLGAHSVPVQRTATDLSFKDPEGLAHRLAPSSVPDQPLPSTRCGVPAEHALLGFDGVRAYSAEPQASELLLEGLGFATLGPTDYEVRGEHRGSTYSYDRPPAAAGILGAGTVHHVAFASAISEHEDWRQRVIERGARATPVIDRFYFRSIYFREPAGVLFEIATLGPGFAVDEDAGSLGESLALPPFLEARRSEIEPLLTPIRMPGR